MKGLPVPASCLSIRGKLLKKVKGKPPGRRERGVRSGGFTDAASWLEVGKMVMSQRAFLSMSEDT